MQKNKILFVKPPDRYLENEFVYQQLGPHYLQSYLAQHDISSNLLVLYEPTNIRKEREGGAFDTPNLEQLNMILITSDRQEADIPFDKTIFGNYDIVGMSVMTPQAPDAYLISEMLNRDYPHITSIIGGSHPRYYQNSVASLPENMAFDFIVPQDGWKPMHSIASGRIIKNKKSHILIDNFHKFTQIPPPTRPVELLKKYNFNISGVNAYHTITALGCPFSCNFCESGKENVRLFSKEMIASDLKSIAEVHASLNHEKKGVMFFDDVGLMTPKQVENLSEIVKKYNFTAWRAFTHAFLVVKYAERILTPFKDSGGKRIGIGLESGSQRSLDLINKRNGQKQDVKDHYKAVKIANQFGIAVDAFTMIYPWEDEQDLKDTTELIEFIVSNPVNGYDEKGRQMKNHIDSTIMTPFEGTAFYSMIRAGKIANVKLKKDFDLGSLFFKGSKGKSGWPYHQTRLSRERYEEEQAYRNSLRPKYR